MKEYLILLGDSTTNQDEINELARQGFVIAFVVSGHERFGMVLYMERDTNDIGDVLTDQEKNALRIIGVRI